MLSLKSLAMLNWESRTSLQVVKPKQVTVGNYVLMFLFLLF